METALFYYTITHHHLYFQWSSTHLYARTHTDCLNRCLADFGLATIFSIQCCSALSLPVYASFSHPFCVASALFRILPKDAVCATIFRILSIKIENEMHNCMKKGTANRVYSTFFWPIHFSTQLLTVTHCVLHCTIKSKKNWSRSMVMQFVADTNCTTTEFHWHHFIRMALAICHCYNLAMFTIKWNHWHFINSLQERTNSNQNNSCSAKNCFLVFLLLKFWWWFLLRVEKPTVQTKEHEIQAINRKIEITSISHTFRVKHKRLARISFICVKSICYRLEQ